MSRLALRLTPHDFIVLEQAEDAPGIPAKAPATNVKSDAAQLTGSSRLNR